jgi:hypothetical protein
MPTTIYSRPATVKKRYSDVARVRFTDTDSLAFVPLEELEA